jgi:hypothetical protein
MAQGLSSFMRDTATYYRRLSRTAAKAERVAKPMASAPAGTVTRLGPPAHERPAMAGSYCRRALPFLTEISGYSLLCLGRQVTQLLWFFVPIAPHSGAYDYVGRSCTAFKPQRPAACTGRPVPPCASSRRSIGCATGFHPMTEASTSVLFPFSKTPIMGWPFRTICVADCRPCRSGYG